MMSDDWFKPRPVWYLLFEECIKKCCHRFVPVISFVIFLTLGYTLFQTFRTHYAPLDVHGEGEAHTSMAGDLIMVEYERDIEVHTEFTGAVSRTIVCQNGWSHDIPAVIRKFDVGTYHANRSFMVPYAVPNATRCQMLTVVTWKPPFSLREHTFEVAPIKFILIPHEHPRRHFNEPHDHGHVRNSKPLTKPNEILK